MAAMAKLCMARETVVEARGRLRPSRAGGQSRTVSRTAISPQIEMVDAGRGVRAASKDEGCRYQCRGQAMALSSHTVHHA
ncbi:uncharacterized protein J3R85_006925 [Psidium guajava]|nr:uncharacterized protein J3R85_006925 [Psidium guajava]